MGRMYLALALILCATTGWSAEWQTVLDHGNGEQDGSVHKKIEQEPVPPIVPLPARQEPVAGDQDQLEDVLVAATRQGHQFFLSQRQEGADEQAAVASTLAYVRQLDGIAEAGVSEDDCTIWMEDRNGYSGLILFKPMEKSDGGGGDTTRGMVSVRAETLNTTPPSSAGNGSKRAIVLEPFENIDGGGDLQDGNPEKIAAIMEEAGFAVTHVRGKDAGIEQFSRLGEYDIVYMHTHCGWKKGNTWMSGEEVTPAKIEEYRQKYGDSVMIGTTGSGQATFTVSSEFIRKIKQFQGTLIYVSGCNSSRDKDASSMAAALKDMGASAYIGYDGYMMAGYATGNTDVDFFKYLILHGLTVSEALAKRPSGAYGRNHPVLKGGICPTGNGLTAIEVDRDKRIAILKDEHRRLQDELVALNGKIQADPSHSNVREWEMKMDQIRKKQQDIYQRVIILKG